MKGISRGGRSERESESVREKSVASRIWKFFIHTETRNFSSFAFLASFELLSCVYSVTVEFFLYLFSQSKVFRFSVSTFTTQCQTTSHIDNGEHKFEAFNALKCGLNGNFQCWKIYIIFFFFQKKKNQKKFPNFFFLCLRRSVCVRESEKVVRENPREENSFFSFRHFFLFWIFFCVIGKNAIEIDEISVQFKWKVMGI